MLEYHHRIPFAEGGQATADNIELRCRAHNGYEAVRWFGADIAREATAAYAGAGSGTDFMHSSGANGPESVSHSVWTESGGINGALLVLPVPRRSHGTRGSP